ncbi:hypothetical protein [Halorubrum sp. C191]|uniref:hypothetical protein n=1 Tax=Halorubrum sp. C191 TaxID=1383842 RepID=UPI001181BB5E|nr:hypothetical protein [Halorubrum sp. C191]
MTDGDHAREHPTEAKYRRLCRHAAKLDAAAFDDIGDEYHEQAHEDIEPVLDHIADIVEVLDANYDSIDADLDYGLSIDDEVIERQDKPAVAGECVECGADIYYGEWHVLRKSECDRVPDGVATKVAAGRPDGERVCAECSDRDRDDFPERGDDAGS